MMRVISPPKIIFSFLNLILLILVGLIGINIFALPLINSDLTHSLIDFDLINIILTYLFLSNFCSFLL